MKKAAVFGLCSLLLTGGPGHAQTSPETNLQGVVILQEFVGGGDANQCNGGAYGSIISPGDTFSPPISIDTDDRPGGCSYRIGILDTSGTIKRLGFGLRIGFHGERRQCLNQGDYDVPIADDMAHFAYTPAIGMNTDRRPGGCAETWTVSGQEVGLELRFSGGAGQCGNTGEQSTFNTNPVQIVIDTDQRPGGCSQSLRLLLRGQ